ncbi:MAG TPA: hypothetical protein VG167_20865 [Verrucomicrobiae bacterium]|nr:hypothetical protein [Verrucomicrobiae bacterium]
MILEMTATALISLGGPTTAGASDAARFVACQAGESRRRLQASYALGLQSHELFAELLGVAEGANTPGWDGYGAEAVTAATYRNAFRFIEALPLGTRAPSISAEPDGQIAFEWYVSPHRTLSVSISPEGDLHYSALLGPNKAFGTEVFLGEMPKSVLELVGRVHAV